MINLLVGWQGMPLQIQLFPFLHHTISNQILTPVLGDELVGRYYLRIHVRDEEGVLAKISDILAKEHISFATVNQKELEDGTAKLMVTTHMSSEAAIKRATALLNKESFVIGAPVSFRIFDYRS